MYSRGLARLALLARSLVSKTQFRIHHQCKGTRDVLVLSVWRPGHFRGLKSPRASRTVDHVPLQELFKAAAAPCCSWPFRFSLLSLFEETVFLRVTCTRSFAIISDLAAMPAPILLAPSGLHFGLDCYHRDIVSASCRRQLGWTLGPLWSPEIGGHYLHLLRCLDGTVLASFFFTSAYKSRIAIPRSSPPRVYPCLGPDRPWRDFVFGGPRPPLHWICSEQ